MSASGVNGRRTEEAISKHHALSITNGEVNFLWWFIQGSIMNSDTWARLMNSYGFCERHAWIHLSIETSFRDRFLLGPTILYQGLLDKALHSMRPPRISAYSRIRDLRATDACMLCAMNIPESPAVMAPASRLDRGRDVGALRRFVSGLETLWRGYLCNLCHTQKSNVHIETLCRRHLLSHMRQRKALNIAGQRELLNGLYEGVTRYQNSLAAGGKAASDQDRAALIGAIGWCSGWRPLLAMLGSAATGLIDVELCEH